MQHLAVVSALCLSRAPVELIKLNLRLFNTTLNAIQNLFNNQYRSKNNGKAEGTILLVMKYMNLLTFISHFCQCFTETIILCNIINQLTMTNGPDTLQKTNEWTNN